MKSLGGGKRSEQNGKRRLCYLLFWRRGQSNVRSGEPTLPRPVEVITSRALGTGGIPCPSSSRSIVSKPSQPIGLEQTLKPTEKNGSTVIDITPEQLTFLLFTWRPPQPVGEIDTIKPALVSEMPRQA